MRGFTASAARTAPARVCTALRGLTGVVSLHFGAGTNPVDVDSCAFVCS